MKPRPDNRLFPQHATRMAAVIVVAIQMALFPAPSGSAQAAKDYSLIQLPPFIVNDSRFKLSLWNWGYMSFPGYEVLTGCERGISNEFVMGAARQISILHDLAPAAFEAPTSVPTSLILLNLKQAQAITDDMKRTMAERPDDSNLGTAALRSHIIYFPQLRLHDTESTAINLILGDPRSSDAVIVEPGYIRYLMESRVPRLPDWYVEAMTDLYRNASFSSSGVEADAQGRLTLGSTSVTFSPVAWTSEKDSKALREQPTRMPSLLPMESIFFEEALHESSDESSKIGGRLWRVQSDLFLQWVITDKHRTRINALKKFLDCGDAGRRDEVAFRECFGVGFEQMQDELGKFLHSAMEKPVAWHSEGGGVDEGFRDATPAETARIWGNWELMEIQYVRARDPQMVYPYVYQAEHTLGDAYKGGERDPGFLSILGLYESDKRDSGEALPILESVAASRAAYPRVYTELARIRLHEALANPTGTDGKLGAEQIASVAVPLSEGRRLSPPQEANYMLLALALGNSRYPPSPGDVAVLDEGLRFFPAESELATLVDALKDRRGANGVSAGSNAR